MSMFHVPAAPGGTEPILVQETVQPAGQPTAEHSAEDNGAELWLLLAFVIMLAIIARPAWRAVTRNLDTRAAKISNELEEAQRLREEAQAALATFQRKHEDALHEAEAIIAHARSEAERARSAAAAEIEQTLARRETLAMQRIAQAESAAVAEVRNLAVDIAVAASRRLIAESTDAAKAQALVDQAIAELPQKLH